jgi:hypothetical protein
MEFKSMRKLTKNGIEKARKLQEALQVIREARMELEAKNDINASLSDQLYHWHQVRTHYDAIKAIASEAEQLSRRMSYEQLPMAFRQGNAPTTTVKLAGIGRFTLSQRTTAKVVSWPDANEFLLRNNRGDAVREMVPASTMNSIVGELLKEGAEPDLERDGIEANTYSYTSFTKE